MHIVNGRKFDENTSELLHDSGDYQAMEMQDGRLCVYRSPKGTVWSTLSWWPNEFGNMRERVVVGEDAVRRLTATARRERVLEALFGPLEEG